MPIFSSPLNTMTPYELPRHALIIAGDEGVRELVGTACRAAGFALVHARDLQEAKPPLAVGLPDLIVLDWPHAGQNGLALLAELQSRERTSRVPIVVTAARARSEDAVAALDAGADDYVPRPFSYRELLARLNAVVRRCAPELSDDEVSYGPLTIHPRLGTVFAEVRGKTRSCTVGPTEFRLLHFLMIHPELLHSRESIREKVWRGSYISERTVDVHVRRLREALDRVSLRTMVQTVKHGGYRLTMDDTDCRPSERCCSERLDMRADDSFNPRRKDVGEMAGTRPH